MTKLFPNYKRADIEFIQAKENQLIDNKGKSYLDFSSGIGVTNLGFHPLVCTALEKQANYIWHTPNLYQNSLQEEVATKLIGENDYLAYFCNSGAEANEAAIKLARKATQKTDIITFINSFHGRTFGAMSATGQDKIQKGFGDLVPNFKYAIFNDIDSVKSLISEQTAAIMLELVQGESGVLPADKTFISQLSSLCQDNDILLIIDEVQTGMGRTGKLYAYEHYNISPDIVTLAKGLANGVPVGAMLGKSKLGFAFSPGSHGSTFGGNKLAMAASSATLGIMLTPNFLNQALDKGNTLQKSLSETLSNLPSVISIRGLGLMIGIETKANLNDVIQKAQENGLIVLSAGENVIRLLPPLTLTQNNIEKATNILKNVFETIYYEDKL